MDAALSCCLEEECNDSNALILPSKQKNKNKKKGSKNQASNNQNLSKSQKRKLKKLEEDKEKAVLLSKSIETLEKYKIPDDIRPLFWSSHSLGQAETVREKRQREVLYGKAGLELPSSGQHSKKRKHGDQSFEVDRESDRTQSLNIVNHKSADENIGVQTPVSLQLYKQAPLLEDQEGFLGGEDDVPLETVDKKEAGPSTQSSLSSTNNCGEGNTRKSMVNFNKEKHKGNILGSPDFSSSERPITDSVMVDISGVKEDEKGESSLCSTNNLTNPFHERTLSAPMVVHVSRPESIQNQRKDLPIVMMEQEIMEKINESTSLIICGETGCGKTTQVPQFLYEAGFGSKSCNARGGMIGVTQPRRVAVLSTAKRVAFELGLRLGKEIGFQVRHDRMIGKDCSIKFMTDGILLREVQNDFLLKRYSTIILDEAHERSLNTDILIGMLSRVIQVRQKEYEMQQKMAASGNEIKPENRIYPLKLILMSATLRVEDFTTNTRIFSAPPPVIDVPTRQYEVTIHFSKSTDLIDYIGRAFKKVMSIHKRLPPGGILVFVTGQHEVEYLCRKLRKASSAMMQRASKAKSVENSVSGDIDAEVQPEMKEIEEAFDLQKNSFHHITDRFSSYDEVDEDLSESESDLSADSEDESDLEADEGFLNPRHQESDSNLDNVLKDDVSIASLKAAFGALVGKTADNTEPEGKDVLSASAEAGSTSGSRTTKATKAPSISPMHVLPLYAMLPASAQLRVFDKVKEGERLIVIATNVAETSLTIPGIKYVVDTGREKSKKYNSSNGMETFEVQWISKASAAQRAGRAGRTGPGHCYRLYSSAVFVNILPDFSDAEISKVPVDGVVLLMKSMHIDKVVNFPFPTPPEATSIVEAERCLQVLGALDIKGRLTSLGKAMSRYPMSPRHSRMLLTVILLMQNMKDYRRANLVLAYAVAAAAALSLSNPFEKRFERNIDDTNELKSDEKSGSSVEKEKTLTDEEKQRQKELKENFKMSRARFSNPTSDTLTIAYALQCFELSSNPVEFCSEKALHLKTMEEMSKLKNQLLHLVFNSKFADDLQQEFLWPHGTEDDVTNAWRNVSTNKNPLLLNEEEILGQAICAGWADRVAKRTKPVFIDGERKVNATHYQACLVQETIYLHRWSSLSKIAPEFLVYTELRHTKRPYIHGGTVVKPDWLIKYASSMCTFSSPHSDPKPFYDPVTDRVLCWVTPTFGPHLWQLPLYSIPIKDDTNRVTVFAYCLLKGQVLPCMKAVQKFMAASPESILKPEASGIKRVGNLVSKLKIRRRIIDSCARLREVWKDNATELFLEIRDWFQEGFHSKFEEVWREMQVEILMEPKDRFPKKEKKTKRR